MTVEHLSLSTARTVDRALVHRACLGEVFVTDSAPAGEETTRVRAQLPRAHSYFTDHLPRTGPFDPLLVIESGKRIETRHTASSVTTERDRSPGPSRLSTDIASPVVRPSSRQPDQPLRDYVGTLTMSLGEEKAAVGAGVVSWRKRSSLSRVATLREWHITQSSRHRQVPHARVPPDDGMRTALISLDGNRAFEAVDTLRSPRTARRSGVGGRSS